jgi:hypothetical protein
MINEEEYLVEFYNIDMRKLKLTIAIEITAQEKI